jgi:hypothetical protein
MGLLDKLQPYLNVLEYEAFDKSKFQEAFLAVKTNCLNALPEVRHFYATLT